MKRKRQSPEKNLQRIIADLKGLEELITKVLKEYSSQENERIRSEEEAQKSK